MEPQEFVAKWHNVTVNESQGAQTFFNDICALVDHPDIVSYGNTDAFNFEFKADSGRADAFLENHFGWEFKSKDSDLDEALNQLLKYQVHLKTPPLLIVSSFQTIRIQTNVPGMVTVRHVIPVAELDRKEHLDKLKWAFHAPDEFRPDRTLEDATKETADVFHAIVQDMEKHNVDAEKLARYLNQIVFCLYAEDAGLLPEGLFTNIVNQQNHDAGAFDQVVQNLFGLMASGGFFGADHVRHFNGDLFSTVDTVIFSPSAMLQLHEATKKDWRNIEPSIFGTLFERALDASKRSQLGAHYTGAADIDLVVQPVVMDPLRREWDTARQDADALAGAGNDIAARARLQAFQDRLASVKVLDPACGSGNFLYTALRSLLDLEKDVIDFNDARDWEEMVPRVQPNQMLGLEINAYAAELARTALWIGYIQWHLSNGIHYRQTPILTPMDTIRQTDAILAEGDTENPQEAEWPAAEFIIGNPPFLGSQLLRSNLGDEYVNAMFSLYGDRLTGGSDLVCYWFEKARSLISTGNASRAGLLATQGIRGGTNRRVLQQIKECGDIFLAWSDQPWILDGAAVHTSIVGFDDGSEVNRQLDGDLVKSINSNLTTGVDLTAASRLKDNLGIAFMGDIKVGSFEIDKQTADEMLRQPNPHGKPNSDVIKPWMIGRDINQISRNMRIIDFGANMLEAEAALYEAPFEYVVANVKQHRIKNRMRRRAERWWLHGSAAPKMRQALNGLQRYIGTSEVSRHRMFSYIDGDVLPDHTIIVFARDDDYTFGILHSRIHELWALAMGTQLESRPRYTPTTCFETFPFPEPTDAQRTAIAEAAALLNERREGWLNPLDATEAELRKRTLTNLYNQRPTWLANLHATLDAAVAAAYGWPADLPDAAILENLLALNLQRSE